MTEVDPQYDVYTNVDLGGLKEQLGDAKIRVTAAKGADPKEVEREVALSLDAASHGAFIPVYPKPSFFELIGAHARVAWYAMFHKRKFIKSPEKNTV